jgi:hypothetical protein
MNKRKLLTDRQHGFFTIAEEEPDYNSIAVHFNGYDIYIEQFNFLEKSSEKDVTIHLSAKQAKTLVDILRKII